MQGLGGGGVAPLRPGGGGRPSLEPRSQQRPSLTDVNSRRPSNNAPSSSRRPSRNGQSNGNDFDEFDKVNNGDLAWQNDEQAMLSLYGITTLAPTEWQDAEAVDGAFSETGQPTTAAAAAKGDEQDPLGLMRGGVLASNPDLPADLRSAVLLHSKTFDPKVFLSTVHPNATFKDLNKGRDRLKDSLEQRSGALKLLVQAEWDRFVSVKAATESESPTNLLLLILDLIADHRHPDASTAVYEEMRQPRGPLASDADHGVKQIRETLKVASTRADNVFQPILDARTKAERLKSTLGVFERSKFFFNLPTILGEAVEDGRYEVALQAYKQGRYILASRPAQLLGLPVATTPQQQQQQKRIYDKVWGQVEKIIGDLRATLGKRLRDTRRGLDEVEKTIVILLELDPTDDPVWIFFDTQHRHILQLLRTSAEASTSRIRIAMDHATDEMSAPDWDRKSAADLRTCVASLEALDGEGVRENAAGSDVWRLIYDLVRNLNEVILQNLPSFWKVAKGYMEGKYQKKVSSNPSSHPGVRRSPTQCRVMSQDIVTLYVSLLSVFFGLSSAGASPPMPSDPADPNALPPLPSFVPPNANATSNCHWLLRTLHEMVDCASDLTALELAGEASQSLKELVGTSRWRFEEAICSSWVRDAKVFFRLETWYPDPDEPSTTAYLRQVAAFQRFCAISAYRIAGGTEERAQALMGSNASSNPSNQPSSRSRSDVSLPTEFVKKIQAAFLDGLYAFLDGLVHVAFSDPEHIFASPAQGSKNATNATARRNLVTTGEDGRSKEVDIRNVDIRVLLTVSNLTHLRETSIPRIINQFQSAFKIDMEADVQMLMDVTEQLDKILFDDYVKRKSADVARILRKGVLGGTVDWFEAAKPTEVHPFIYDALLSLVLVHAQVSATARPLVARTLGSLVEELANVALDAFGKVERFGMGGMLQATLEIEFMHQTLSQHVSPLADSTLQSIYKTISQSYYRRPTPDSAQELQKELEGLKRTLVASRRATALQFLCFRKPSAAKKDTASGGGGGEVVSSPVPGSPAPPVRELNRTRRAAMPSPSGLASLPEG
ncbi:BQ2448_596 [Microbotryum intermedium]|uniref:Exocyst complex component SEC5 n=1 Tax=Microbotryum intermedium TaxID=269621 RepID=A0A238F5Q7_9BASI|nr:BQ2448_596 [Microbotryum intermedium]